MISYNVNILYYLLKEMWKITFPIDFEIFFARSESRCRKKLPNSMNTYDKLLHYNVISLWMVFGHSFHIEILKKIGTKEKNVTSHHI